MLLKLTPQGTDAKATPIEIRHDRPAVLGRSSAADFTFANDSYMSSRHFEVRFEKNQWLAKDLDSSNGVLLNGEKITESPLKPGDELRAGSNTFHVEFVDDSPKPPPLVALEVLQNESEPVFAVIDAAASPDLYQLILGYPDRSISLFDGTPLEEAKPKGPHVVNLGDAGEQLMLEFVYGGWAANAMVYATSTASFEDLAGHLKSLLLAKTEDGRRLLFRYYDPRVLRAYLPTCKPAELAEFCGPVVSWFAEEDDVRWWKFGSRGAGLSQEPLDLLSLSGDRA